MWAETQGHWLPVHNASNMKREAVCQKILEEMFWNRHTDRTEDNASKLFAAEWPKPTRCDTALLERLIVSIEETFDSSVFEDL